MPLSTSLMTDTSLGHPHLPRQCKVGHKQQAQHSMALVGLLHGRHKGNVNMS